MTESEVREVQIFDVDITKDLVEKLDPITDWVHRSILGWKLPDKRLVPTDAVWLGWTSEPRLAEWSEWVLEISCSRFSGNLSGLDFAFTLEDLTEEMQTGNKFKLPPKRFVQFSQGLLGSLPLEVETSYLPGVFYERELEFALYGQGAKWPTSARKWNSTRCWLVTGEEKARNLLVKIFYRGEALNDMIANQDPFMMSILNRADVMSHHVVSKVVEGRLETSLFMMIDLAVSSDLIKKLHE